MNTTPLTINLSLLVNDKGEVQGIVPAEEGERITIDRAAVKASSSTLVKKSEGQLLAKRIKDAMEQRNLTATDVAAKAGISRQSLYGYLRSPAKASLGTLLTICRTVGIQQITLQTTGTYR